MGRGLFVGVLKQANYSEKTERAVTWAFTWAFKIGVKNR
jgi:hypothetical protein